MFRPDVDTFQGIREFAVRRISTNVTQVHVGPASASTRSTDIDAAVPSASLESIVKSTLTTAAGTHVNMAANASIWSTLTSANAKQASPASSVKSTLMIVRTTPAGTAPVLTV